MSDEPIPPWRSTDSEATPQPSNAAREEKPPPAQPTAPEASATARKKGKSLKKKKKKPKKSAVDRYAPRVSRAMEEGSDPDMLRRWLKKKGLSQDEIGATLRRAERHVEERQDAREEELQDEQADFEEEVEEQRAKDRRAGALWFGSGILLTLATCSAADDGGSYVLAGGPMAYGAFRLFRGLQ